MIRITRFAKTTACGIALLLGTGSAQAVVIHGDNFDIDYTSVAAFGLYNVPSIIGNNIFFAPNPDDFNANGLNGASDSINGTATFDVIAHTGFNLESLVLVERGNYLLDGVGSTVTHNGALDVSDPFDIFAPAINEDILELAPLTINDNTLNPWEARATADIAASLFAGTTRVHVIITNQLQADSGPTAPSESFIDKNFSAAPVMLGVNEFPAAPVPVPAAVWLFGSGLLGLFGVARQRSRRS